MGLVSQIRLIKRRDMKKVGIVGLVLLVACSLQASSRLSLLPSEADLVLRISSISELGEAMKTTSFGRLWNDPKFQESLGEYDLEKFLKESMFSDFSEEQRHLHWEEIKMLVGEIAVSVQIAEEKFMLVAEMSEKDFKRSQVMDRRLSELDQHKKMIIHKMRYQGVDIYSHRYENAEKENSYQAFMGETLLMSSSSEWLKRTITAVKSSPIKQTTEEVPELYFRVKMASMINKITKKTEADLAKIKGQMPEGGAAMPDFSPAKIMDAIGISSLKEITMSMKFAKDHLDYTSVVAIENPLKGILSIVDLTPSPIGLRIPYAPERIISYEVSRLNLMELWQQIPQILNQALPPSIAAQANGGLMMSSAMLGIDLGRDLFAHLDTQMIATYLNADPEPEGMYFIRLKNEEALKESLQKVFAETGMMRMQLGEKFKLETFRDASLYEFKIAATNTTFAFTAEDGYLVMGSGEVVRQYLRAIDSSEMSNMAFYKSRLFGELSKRVTAKTTGYSAMDVGKYVKVFLKMIEDNPALKDAMQSSKTQANNPFPNFSIEKLPSAEYMSKFFGASFGQSASTEKGIKNNAIMYYETM